VTAPRQTIDPVTHHNTAIVRYRFSHNSNDSKAPVVFFDPAFHPRSTRSIADKAKFLLRTKAITGKIIHNCAQVQFGMQQQLLTQTLHRLINRAAIFIAKFFFIRMIFFLTILQPVTMNSSSRDGQKTILVLATINASHSLNARRSPKNTRLTVQKEDKENDRPS
jgi:hypothetical protein